MDQQRGLHLKIRSQVTALAFQEIVWRRRENAAVPIAFARRTCGRRYVLEKRFTFEVFPGKIKRFYATYATD